MIPNWREYSRFSGFVARLTRGVDGYQQLGQPERWSRGGFRTVTDPGSAEGSYYVWVDWLDTFGLGRNVPIAMGNLNDSIYALVDGKLITLCVPYPMGMFAKNVDGRIDDPNAGWKGKACDWRGRIPNCYSRPERSQYRSVRSRMPVLSG